MVDAECEVQLNIANGADASNEDIPGQANPSYDLKPHESIMARLKGLQEIERKDYRCGSLKHDFTLYLLRVSRRGTEQEHNQRLSLYSQRGCSYAAVLVFLEML